MTVLLLNGEQRMGLSNQIPSSRLIQPGVVSSAATRPASPFTGQCIFQKDTDQLLVWSGTAWVCTSSLAGLQIDSSGRVTTPLRPAFRYQGFTINATGMQGGDAPLNVGSHLTIGSGATYSKFTVPIAGLYIIGASVLVDQTGGRVEMVLLKNGATTIDGRNYYAFNEYSNVSNGYSNANGSFPFYFNAGEEISMNLASGATYTGDLARGDRAFFGYLVG
jgi:hypothetical protein